MTKDEIKKQIIECIDKQRCDDTEYKSLKHARASVCRPELLIRLVTEIPELIEERDEE